MKPTLKNTQIAPQAAPLLETIVSLIDNARRKVAVTVNSELPEVDKFLPTETGEPPLGRAKNWNYEEK